MDKPHLVALQRAIAICGSQTGLAAQLRKFGKPKASQQTIAHWVKAKILIGADWWVPIERATNFAVTRSDLRPDLFQDPQNKLTVRRHSASA